MFFFVFQMLMFSPLSLKENLVELLLDPASVVFSSKTFADSSFTPYFLLTAASNALNPEMY